MRVRVCSSCGLKFKGRIFHIEGGDIVRCPRCGTLEEVHDDEDDAA